MSNYEEAPPLRQPIYYDTEHWGLSLGVRRLEKNDTVPRPFDVRVAKNVIARILNQDGLNGEKPVKGYNFLPLEFAVGTFFKYRLERLMPGDVLPPTDFAAIVVPTIGKNKLYHLKQVKNKDKLVPAPIASKPLILGRTTDSANSSGQPALEHLHQLEIFEDGSTIWMEEQKKLLSTIKGRIIDLDGSRYKPPK